MHTVTVLSVEQKPHVRCTLKTIKAKMHAKVLHVGIELADGFCLSLTLQLSFIESTPMQMRKHVSSSDQHAKNGAIDMDEI